MALRIALPGASGRMGRTLVRVLAETPGVVLSAAIERPGHADLGRDAGELAGIERTGVSIGSDVEAALSCSDIWIDFTAPEATAKVAEHAAAHSVGMVIGTTGLEAAHRAELERAGQKIPLVVSSNMSVGVQVLLRLIEQATRALGPGFDPEIVEWHHRQKKDAPSGTALMMAESIAQASGRTLARDGRYGREGQVGARTDAEIGVLAVRGGDVVGDHTAFFLGAGERIELTHRASSREIFARGAVRAAKWVSGKAPGLYDMQDVLGLRA